MTDTRPTVLFLCVHNAGRSQMALGFFQHLAGEHAVAWSGGSEPAAEVNPAAIAAMRERDIDIAQEYPKRWTDDVVRAADVGSAWAAATRARSSPASVTRTGAWTTRPG